MSPLVSWPVAADLATILPAGEGHEGPVPPHPMGAPSRGEKSVMMPSVRRAPMIGLIALGLGVAPASDPGPATPRTPSESFPVAIRIDASKPRGDLRPAWRFF